MSSSFGSTKVHPGSSSSVSFVSTDEKPKGVNFEKEKGRSCLKTFRRGRAYSRERASSRSLSTSPSPTRKKETKNVEGERIRRTKVTIKPQGEKEGGIPHHPATPILIKIRREKVVGRNQGKMMRRIKIKQTKTVHPAHEKNGTRSIPHPRRC